MDRIEKVRTTSWKKFLKFGQEAELTKAQLKGARIFLTWYTCPPGYTAKVIKEDSEQLDKKVKENA